MSAELDRHVSPLGVDDVQGIMIHPGGPSGEIDPAVAEPMHAPHRRRRAGDADAEHAGELGIDRPMRFDQPVHAFVVSGNGVDDGDAVLEGPRPQPPAEPPRQSHQVIVIEVVVGSEQLAPPRAKPAGRRGQPEIPIADDSVDAVVNPVEQFRVALFKSIVHGAHQWSWLLTVKGNRDCKHTRIQNTKTRSMKTAPKGPWHPSLSRIAA